MNLKGLRALAPYEWPDDADTTILKTLINKQASKNDRLAAARLAGEIVVMNNEMAETLLSIVQSSSESEEMRGTAAMALGAVLEQADVEMLEDGKFEDPEAVPISETTFRNLVEGLRKLVSDESLPKEVRRRVLEASVRAQLDWHPNAVRTSYASKDKDWKLTAVFCMEYVRGFQDLILEALESSDFNIHYHAIRAAGNWEFDAAWPHIVKLVADCKTPKPLRLAAIEAVASIRPQEAGAILVDLDSRNDEEIAEAADEAMMTAAAATGELDEDDEEGEDEEAGDWMN